MNYSACLLLFISVSTSITSFHQSYNRLSKLTNQITRTYSSNNFNGKEFDDVLKSMGPVWGKKLNEPDKEIYDKIKDQQQQQLLKTEEIYRVYPYESTELPTLADCNNYYSGKYGDYFWHQNADQVYVYIPIDDHVNKNDIKVKFEAKSVEIKVNNKEIISFQCLERIIPDGSFWLFEKDKNNQLYIQLDLEKRFRMINWKGLFGSPEQVVEEDSKTLENRSKVLEKLFAANQGISKLSGIPPESMQEMMKNGDLTRMIANEVYPEPKISTIMDDNTEIQYETIDDNSENEELNLEDMEIIDVDDNSNKE